MSYDSDEAFYNEIAQANKTESPDVTRRKVLLNVRKAMANGSTFSWNQRNYEPTQVNRGDSAPIAGSKGTDIADRGARFLSFRMSQEQRQD